ncbi:DNA primase [compost metagenome]
MRTIKWSDYRNKILAELDNESFFLGELKNVDRRGTEIKAECPYRELHEAGEDKTPSLTVNLSKGVYYCQTCRSKGNAHTLYKYLNKLSNEQAWFDFGDALKIERPESTKPARPEIDSDLIYKYHSALMEMTGPIRSVLRDKRGFTDETLNRFQLGWDGDRVTIPIYDEYNSVVNFRRYKWNSDNDQFKLINYTDEFGNMYGEVRIFGIENLVNDDIEYVVWCEGETDRIINEQYGFPTACPTSGAGAWRPEWLRYFRSKKRVYLAQDNDEAGRTATKKLAERLNKATDVYIINWPENFPNKGDITDFYVKSQMTAADFQVLLDNATKYVDPRMENHSVREIEAKNVHLAESASAQLYGKRMQVPIMVSGKDSTPYIVPKKFKVSCGENADSEKKACQNCALLSCGGEATKELTSLDEDLMKLIKCTKKQQYDTLVDMMGINSKCPLFELDIQERMNIEELRMIPQAEASFSFSKEHEYVVRNGYYIGEKTKANKRYSMVGYMYPDPHTQYANYMFDEAYPEKDLISDFDMTDEVYEQLKVFQPAPGQSIKEKMEHIHKDFERNVTYIWERRDVSIAVDLIYHTVLNFYFQGQFVKRGWGELLIIGDSGQAKSTLVERMMMHYRLGEMHSGESSKRTGLVYSIQQSNKRWFLVWGAFPLNDGGLITLDELSGISEDDLAVMSDVRSSGIAKATGVVTAETTARTRAIYISNPRNGRPLQEETHGVSAVLKLFGKTEDVRRLDLAMSVASGDVDEELINVNVNEMPEVLHEFDSDLCNTRVMWAWSRRPENIIFSDEATKAILKYATQMGRRYTSRIPIVESADQRITIARLAVSCACCMFSTEDGTNVLVKEDHVEYVVDFMNRIYSSKSFGYDKLSDLENVNTDASSERIEDLVKKFVMLPVMNFNELVDTLYMLPYFSRNTLDDSTGMDRDDLKLLLKFLINNHLVEKVRGDYRRMPLGTKFLEHLRNNRLTKAFIDEVRKATYATDEF